MYNKPMWAHHQSLQRIVISRIKYCLMLLLILSSELKSQAAGTSVELTEQLVIGAEKDEIFQWADLETDSDGNIFITDALDFSLKKFSGTGQLVAKTGKKGRGPGEFIDPRLLAIHGDRLYVTQQSVSGIQVFSTNLEYLYSIPFASPIVDLMVFGANEICLAQLAPGGASFLVLDTLGVIRSALSFPSQNQSFIGGFVRFTMDAERSYYIAYPFENKIVKCSSAGAEVWQASPIANVQQKSKAVGNIFVPGEIFYKDIKLDLQGNIFVLSGQPSRNKKQEILILDQRGHLLSTIELPQQTHMIHLDQKGMLYTRGELGTAIFKYFLKYNDNNFE